ncbi:MAG TPA: rhomboid family intramembrane serine protease [Polyangiaceae bacterium]|nr:rhomboid family intramembrane serine protease [Polyangiaceae bacterium]
MLPLRDINPTRTTPFVNWLLILANVFVFVKFLSLPPWYQTGYSLVPSRFFGDPLGEAFTIVTSMFMHAGLAHLGGNMLFLWIFGDNIEDALGHGRYLAFYLLGGLAAATAQVVTSGASPIPMVGASGAIAAVTGAYLVLYPRAPVLMLNPFPPLWLFVGLTFVIPAWFVAGEFFVTNLFMGLQTIGERASGADAKGGVAVFAHLGGFLFGLLTIRPLMPEKPRSSRRDWDGWRPPPPRRA